MALRVLMLVNPTSGKGRASSGAPAAEARLRERGIEVVHIQGVDAEHAVSSLREELDASQADAVVACGGDGTVHLVLQVVAGSGVPMGILPLGTGNDSANLFGVPKDPVAAADLVADCLLSGTSRTVDVGRAVTADGVDRVFLAVLSSGFDSMVNERANTMTWPTGQARYLRAILAELRSFKPVPYRMVIDEGLPGQHVHEGTGMLVAVGNGTQYGGGMKVCPGALPDDGLLSITFLDELPTTTFLRVFPSVYKGTHVTRPEVHEHTGVTVSLDAPGQVAYADGERLGPLPVQVGVQPGAVRLLVR
ncbi:MAG: diacylglycerol kinase [Candidatus Nanopelagicales bacterium]